MTTHAHPKLAQEDMERIRTALGEALADGPEALAQADRVTLQNNQYIVPIEPSRYPESMYRFLEGVAAAEVRLRDSGLPVRLVPDIRQREVVVAWGPSAEKVAYLSRDGSEWKDLAALLGVAEKEIKRAMYDAYAYDNDDELPEAIKDAREEHPDADYSRLTENGISAVPA